MKKYAVIKIKGNQYRVSEGDEILVDKLDGKPEAEVLLSVDGEKIKVGKPKVRGAAVKIKVVNQEEKGKKITVLKYKAKSRYRRKKGFRPVHTKVLIENIS
ncbi:50S ribosomal protein L21 [Candidatus Woesebacteria bacterium RIFCSPHIGHO2_01_FULL_39_17]|uniref:Large ribosomal subunit protein bL21 n=3 Tax=Candidatus Woeseibacteriota TaxID=1752722 RepID=A0A0G0QT22_9BACT|nr:MAG: 50S ribosomal protein L21 [Microgenomates group bacterium GW2011_GWC1_38_12]KKQ93568.1 MAG: 50S ribosomal protein L21 [Candidatus Woesebacteria bacterium GW2011_GWB1_39_10b]KKR13515.1 MAG: 50S ribosomal protein L21 [Candidatus Woesebacteria bacterium GW2011_GWA1_39_21b]OGM22870.1 MAG: 50S ribosomal protein L21 [Candidatus Woesebacteria bacterium RIFCSPHIGHO2_01_FULL_39_17]OGM61923.1 MAG: 50S ribosomal protein L21 [Candidatus Woesebacteria bacterium RIFCSPLOWO2_01_FULL_39_14]